MDGVLNAMDAGTQNAVYVRSTAVLTTPQMPANRPRGSATGSPKMEERGLQRSGEQRHGDSRSPRRRDGGRSCVPPPQPKIGRRRQRYPSHFFLQMMEKVRKRLALTLRTRAGRDGTLSSVCTQTPSGSQSSASIEGTRCISSL